MIRAAIVGAAAGALSFAALGCGNSSGGALTGDDNTDSGTLGRRRHDVFTGVDAGHDANTAHPGDGAVACGTRVDSGVSFTSTGGIYCAADMPCDLTTHTCCVGGLGTGTCVSGHSGCSAALTAAFECVEDSDCPTHQVCCGYADMTTSSAGSKCQDLGSGTKCSPVPSDTQGSVQFCQKTCECKDGTECLPQSCNIPGAPIKAALTMCGIQATAPYNCTAR